MPIEKLVPLNLPPGRPSRAAYKREWRAKNAERERAKGRAYYARTKDRQSAYRKTYHEKHRDRLLPVMRQRSRERDLAASLAAFGLTQEEYNGMAADGCAICGGNDPRGYRLALDHDHETGKFRGLLCGECNTRLGWFERRRSKIEGYLCR